MSSKKKKKKEPWTNQWLNVNQHSFHYVKPAQCSRSIVEFFCTGTLQSVENGHSPCHMGKEEQWPRTVPYVSGQPRVIASVSGNKDTYSCCPGDKAAAEIKGDSGCIAKHLQHLCFRWGVLEFKGSPLPQEGEAVKFSTAVVFQRRTLLLRTIAKPHLCPADSIPGRKDEASKKTVSSFVPNRPTAQVRSSDIGGTVSVPICSQRTCKFDGSRNKRSYYYPDII